MIRLGGGWMGWMGWMRINGERYAEMSCVHDQIKTEFRRVAVGNNELTEFIFSCVQMKLWWANVIRRFFKAHILSGNLDYLLYICNIRIRIGLSKYYMFWKSIFFASIRLKLSLSHAKMKENSIFSRVLTRFSSPIPHP